MFWEYADAPKIPDGPYPRSGKWLLFASPEHHNEVWRKIEEATKAGRLGYTSKTTARSRPDYSRMSAMVTCVYTYDFDDQDDVRRVLTGLRSLGFSARLAYKTDADTLEGHYGKGTSAYVSQPGSLDFEDRRSR
jgi:hypothetical protein